MFREKVWVERLQGPINRQGHSNYLKFNNDVDLDNKQSLHTVVKVQTIVKYFTYKHVLV